MSYSLAKLGSRLPTQREVAKVEAYIDGKVQIERKRIRAIGLVGTFAADDALYLKQLQRQMEHLDPDAAEAVGFIINTSVMAIGRRVAQFDGELD
ncbi:MAG TPA: hypothetical protein VGL93_14490 [Streptosporangiaceae bacterium]|jgi:hypothetical protein